MKEDLKKQYFENEYIRDIAPYKLYMSSLENVFDFSIINNFMDLGCNSGRLIEAIKRKYPSVNVKGVDYFEWAIKYADESIKNFIEISDLSFPVNFAEKYSIVNCSEVGEHIEKECEDVFLNNLVNAVDDILILTWSNEPSHGNDQHQNPRPKNFIIQTLAQKGLFFWKSITDRFAQELDNNLANVGYQWWSENVMIFKKIKFIKTAPQYFIQGINTNNGSHQIQFINPDLTLIPLQKAFISLINKIQNSIANKNSLVVIRASDGDYFFLREIPIGSAKPGNRALKKPYEQIDMCTYRRLFWENDIIAVSFEKPEYQRWTNFLLFSQFLTNQKGRFYNVKKKICEKINAFPFLIIRFLQFGFIKFNQKSISKNSLTKSGLLIHKQCYPLEAVYALVATKWVFRTFPNEIGIIANEEKIKIVNRLMENDEYRKYIGVESFCDYIPVPQIGAADDLFGLSKTVGEKIVKSKAKIFLVGVGSVKTGLLPLLKGYSDAIFIDVGCGIDALAGIVCQERPYFADWINYRMKNYDYSKVDFMDKGNPSWENPEYRTIWINN
jgi:hypothetical protein